ncbi:MAG: hypothetical protein PHE09_08485 [Oscillospiraceae bacterium]|nr:hypothetical protein [Oscillospiraceae bacterium]
MKKIRVTKKKLAIALCIAIPAAVAAVLVPGAIKKAKYRKHACV